MISYNHPVYRLASSIPFLVTAKRIVDVLEIQVFALKRLIRRHLRQLTGIVGESKGQLFATLCVKQTRYAEMALFNINSLHYINPHHRWRIYCDEDCANYLKSHLWQLDYPGQMQIIEICSKATKPWQYYKLQALISVSRDNGALVDADSRWYAEPPINDKSARLLTCAYELSENIEEMEYLHNLFPQIEFKGFKHYATGYIYIPKDYLDSKFTDTLWMAFNMIQENMSNFGRLADELAINIALQSNTTHKIEVLKDADGPGNRHILQSYYYGCWNSIIS